MTCSQRRICISSYNNNSIYWLFESDSMVDFFEVLAYRANYVGVGALNFKARAVLSSLRPFLERL